jgi:hypothetical protein
MVMVNGAQVASFTSLENVDVSWGFGVEEIDYVGADAPEIDETNGPATITFRINPKSPDFGRLMDLRRKRALPQDQRQNVVFDIVMRVNYGDGGVDRWKFPDVRISEGSMGASGRKNRVTGSMTAVCAKPSRTV